MEEQGKKENRKSLFLMIFGVLVLVLLAAGATYAYFQAQAGDGAKADIDATTGTTDNLTFKIEHGEKDTDDKIIINATQENFAKGGKDLYDDVNAIATLTANNTTNSATMYYNVYLDITDNDFEYTQEGEIPELYLTITKDGEVYSEVVTSLKQVELQTENGSYASYDITETSGLIKIAEKVPITASGATPAKETDTWNIKITFKNLDKNQNGNSEKTFNGEVIIQEGEYSNQDRETLKTLLANANKTEQTLYHHDGSNPNDADDDSYRYSGPSYKIASLYQDQFTKIDDEIIKFSCDGEDMKSDDFGIWECDGYYISDRYFYIVNNPEEHFNLTEKDGGCTTNGWGSNVCRIDSAYVNALESGIEKGYIETVVNNYICFDDEIGKCSDENNLYRIIGLFKTDDNKYEIKVIKNTSIGEMNWHSWSDDWDSIKYRNHWEIATLKQELNDESDEFYTGLSNIAKSLIVNHKWQIRGSSTNNVSAQQFYKYEMGLEEDTGATSLVNPTTTIAKIGLMYASDYGFAANPTYWATNLYNYGISAYNEDWLFINISSSEWTISRNSNSYEEVYKLSTGIYNSNVYEPDHVINSFMVRPSFYLSSNVKIISGDGSFLNPYRVSM